MTSGFEKSGTVLTVHLPAELDHPASDEIRRDSDRIIGHNYIKNIIFDFSETVFMDSSGIGLIMGRYKKVMFIGGKAAVTNVGNAVDRIFKISGLYKIIEKYDTIQEALYENRI